MKNILNVLIQTKDTNSGLAWTELYPIAFKTLDEIDYELKCEGFTKQPIHPQQARIKSKYTWTEESLIKTATVKLTAIAR